MANEILPSVSPLQLISEIEAEVLIAVGSVMVMESVITQPKLSVISTL